MTSQYKHSSNLIGDNIIGDGPKLLVGTELVLEVVLLKLKPLGDGTRCWSKSWKKPPFENRRIAPFLIVSLSLSFVYF